MLSDRPTGKEAWCSQGRETGNPREEPVGGLRMRIQEGPGQAEPRGGGRGVNPAQTQEGKDRLSGRASWRRLPGGKR